VGLGEIGIDTKRSLARRSRRLDPDIRIRQFVFSPVRFAESGIGEGVVLIEL